VRKSFVRKILNISGPRRIGAFRIVPGKSRRLRLLSALRQRHSLCADTRVVVPWRVGATRQQLTSSYVIVKQNGLSDLHLIQPVLETKRQGQLRGFRYTGLSYTSLHLYYRFCITTSVLLQKTHIIMMYGMMNYHTGILYVYRYCHPDSIAPGRT